MAVRLSARGRVGEAATTKMMTEENAVAGNALAAGHVTATGGPRFVQKSRPVYLSSNAYFFVVAFPTPL